VRVSDKVRAGPRGSGWVRVVEFSIYAWGLFWLDATPLKGGVDGITTTLVGRVTTAARVACVDCGGVDASIQCRPHSPLLTSLSLLPSFLPLRQSVSPRFSPDLSIDAVSWPYKSLPKSYPVSAVCRRPVRPWSQLGCRLPCRIQSLLSCQRICWRYGRDAGQLEDPRPDVNFEIHSWTYRLSGLPF